MSASPHNDTLQPGVLSGSGHTPASRPPASSRDLSASRRVCFYKSGDPQFSGHRVVINSRTFKTFDALLDALSKKVPLPFGVRNITTPRGTHSIQNLDELRDGASYVCSDRRRVKPLNLDQVNRRQVPWNTTRPSSSRRQGRRGLIRQLARQNEVGRTPKGVDRTLSVWTPKRLVVFKNRDPSTKRTVVLHKRTAPTFEALLDYLSQVLQFPVVKLYTADGRRVEGLSALILCSGTVVAAGNESFRLDNFNLQGSSQPSQSAISETPVKTQLLPYKKQSDGSRPRSRHFSLSSEKYFVNQINKSLSGSLSGDDGQRTESMATEKDQPLESEEMETSDCVVDIKERDHFVMPSEDDIEKSFRVNQDGSMTVEMKVRLTIKHEEVLHWTTTLSRTCTNSQQMAVCNSSDNNNYQAREAKTESSESKEDNALTAKSVRLNEKGEDHSGSATSEALGKPKPAFRRLPTPGPRRIRRKEASVENVKRVSQNLEQESTVGAYSYMECTAEGELTEGYCVVSRSSSSSTRPVPKPRKTSSGESKHRKTQSSLTSSRMAEVLQLQNNGAEITETVMRIYESQGTYENYFANTDVSSDTSFEISAKTREPRKPDSTDSGPRSSSNDCDVDLSRQSTNSDSQNTRIKELLSLSSGQSGNNLCLHKNSEQPARSESEHESTDNRKSKVTQKSVKSKKSSPSDTSACDKRQKGSVPGSLKDLRKSKSPESLSHTGSEIKGRSSAESDKLGEKAKKKKKCSGSQKNASPNLNSGVQKESTEKDLNLDDATAQKTPKKMKTRDSHNRSKSPVKKKLLDVMPPPHFKMLAKQRSMTESRTKSSEENRELSESVSMPVLHSSPSNVNQYVENWLKKIQPESVPYMEEMDPAEAENGERAKFWVGSGSAESSEIKNEPDKENLEKKCPSLDAQSERPVSRPLVQIRFEGEPVEMQKVKGFCKSMPSVRIQPTEQESGIRMNKSSEALIRIQPDTEGEASESPQVNTSSGVRPVLQQLCLSIQSIRRTSSHSHLASLKKKKSSSLPDFSSQVASVFGSPSKALLSFLSVMTLKDGFSSSGNEALVRDSGSYPEALQVMQSLEKIASIEDEEELKASLTSLQSSASSELKKSWKNFQERLDAERSPPLSPRQSEQEFALEVFSEGEDQEKDHNIGIRELMDELNVSEDLRREISSLVDGQPTTIKPKLTSDHSQETTDSENVDTKDDFLDEEVGYSVARVSQEDNLTGVEETGVSEIRELDNVESCPPLRKDITMENSDISENSQTVKCETILEDIVEQVQVMEEENSTEKATCHAGELEVPDHTKISVIDGADLSELQSEVPYVQFSETEISNDRKIDIDEHYINGEEDYTYQHNKDDTEHPETVEVKSPSLSPTSEAEHDQFNNWEECELDESQEAKHKNSAVVQEDDFDFNEKVNKSDEEEQQNKLKSKDFESQHQESGIASYDPEIQNSFNLENGNEDRVLDSPSTEQNLGEIYVEEDKWSEELESSAGDADSESSKTLTDGPMEDKCENEDTMSKASENENLDAESHLSLMSDQYGQLSNKTDKGSCKSQRSEEDLELQSLEEQDEEEEGVTEKNISSAEEKDGEDENKQSSSLDSDKKIDALPNDSVHVDDEDSDQNKTQVCKTQESEAEDELQTPQKETDEEAEEQENEQCSTLDSDKDVDAEPEPNSPATSDQEGDYSDQNKSGSCKSQASESECEHQPLENGVIGRHASSAEATDQEMDDHEDKQSSGLDSDNTIDAEPNFPAVADQDDEDFDRDKAQSSTSQESEAEQKVQTPKQDTDEEADEQDNKECEDFDAEPEPNFFAMSDQEGELTDQTESRSFKSDGDEKDVEGDDQEDKLSNASAYDEEFNTKTNNPAESGQLAQLSDQGKAWSYKSQELEEGDNDTEEKDKELDDHEMIKDFYTKEDHPVISDGEDQEETQLCKSQGSETEHELHTKDEDNKGSNALWSEKDSDAQSYHSYTADIAIKQTVRVDSFKTQDTETFLDQLEDNEEVKDAGVGQGHFVHPMEISQELLDLVNFALSSSVLTFTCDSKGQMRIEPDRCKIRGMSLAKSNGDNQYAQKRLPSPNTSDLSDYRPETSDSGRDMSRDSTDFTETGEEEGEKLPMNQGTWKQSGKEAKTFKTHQLARDNSCMKINLGPDTKHIPSPSLKSINSLASFHDSMADATVQEPAYSNTSCSLNEDSESVQRAVFRSDVDSSEGVLIDKGRWLLKENHLIRKSPPVQTGMYGNADTTSADTGLDNISEDLFSPPCENQNSPLAVISSSELEEMAKPAPKCTYFSMPHSSDSDPFLDSQSVNSSKGGGDIRKNRELKVSPMVGTSKTWAKKNGSLPSFASVEFKLPDGKVHPEGGLASGAMEKTARPQSISSRAAQEEEPVEGLNLRCGRHCPIL
ncbi:oxygen-regulated protein 1 [Hoplias malabaricus]|uniref:oxygen-regulated protein 1 n=1 Tax=Hoplias malabaricus TaxID=27720 RepID=UPI0034633713